MPNQSTTNAQADVADSSVADDSQQEAKQSNGGEALLHVKVYAPFQIYFEGDATSVSADNATGPFDILPGHHNFLCMLVPCDVKVATNNGPKNIAIHRALMHVKDDRVVVFVDV